jgi:hypothetical protein
MPMRDNTESTVTTDLCIECRMAHSSHERPLYHRELPGYWRLLNELILGEREAARIGGLWIGNEAARASARSWLSTVTWADEL